MNIKAQYLTKKIHFWRGSYQRLFVIGENGFATCELQSQTVTNEWSYIENFDSIEAKGKQNEFTLNLKKNSG